MMNAHANIVLRPELRTELDALKSAQVNLRMSFQEFLSVQEQADHAPHNAVVDISVLTVLCSSYSRHLGISSATLSNKVTSHARLFQRIKNGQGCSVLTFNKTMNWFSANWPADLDWPEGIARPEVPASCVSRDVPSRSTDVTGLTQVADIYAHHLGLSESTVSSYALNDGKLLRRYREDGADITTRRLSKALAWFSAIWPADLDWPEGIARPEVEKISRGESA